MFENRNSVILLKVRLSLLTTQPVLFKTNEKSKIMEKLNQDIDRMYKELTDKELTVPGKIQFDLIQ